MSGVPAAAGVGASCPSKLTKYSQNPNQITLISSHFYTHKTAPPIKGRNFKTHCSLQLPIPPTHHHQLFSSIPTLSTDKIPNFSHASFVERMVLIDLDPTTAKLVIPFLGPFLSAFGFLFIVRIVMSWYPKLPVDKFPYVIAYAPTEPLLIQTRKVIQPLGGVDVTPVVWFALISFLNEILVGPQGLLVLLSQQV